MANQNTLSSGTMDIIIYLDETMAYATTDFNKRIGKFLLGSDVREITKQEIKDSEIRDSRGNGCHLSIVNTQLKK